MNAQQVISSNRRFIILATLGGGVLGLAYSVLEYSLSDRPLSVLILLGLSAGFLIGFSVSIFESLSTLLFRHRTFIQAILIRTVFYLLIILGWLMIINTINNMIVWQKSVIGSLILYVSNESFIYNISFALAGILVLTTFYQISKLHRKGELNNYILGRYHEPREVEQLFLFVDLKSSTKIAESIGNLTYGKFLRDYYADITGAIHATHATVYQYVGDEIVLTWPLHHGLHRNRCLEFVVEMRNTFDHYADKYQTKYGFIPEFRAGLHGGKVLITWIGEVKKEIVYFGDVLNTTARIAEECKKAKHDFLLSGQLFDQLSPDSQNRCQFYDKLQLRGKEEEIRIYSHPIRPDIYNNVKS